MHELTETPLLTQEHTEFEGTYQGFRTIFFDGLSRSLYRFELTDGTTGTMLGTAILNGYLTGIDPGTKIRIRREADKPSSKKGYSPMKQFRVWIDD